MGESLEKVNKNDAENAGFLSENTAVLADKNGQFLIESNPKKQENTQEKEQENALENEQENTQESEQKQGTFSIKQRILNLIKSIKNPQRREHKKSKNRVWEIDFLRGVCILLMVFDHTMYDFSSINYWVADFTTVNNIVMNNLHKFAVFWWNWDIRLAFRLAVVFLFLTLSGISCSLSRHNGKRLIRLTLASLIFSFATYIVDLIFDLGAFIAFGIIHIMAISLLIYMLLSKLWNNKYFILIIGIILTLIGAYINLPSRGTGLPYYDILPYADSLNINVIIGTANLPPDSYGIVPYTGIFLIGTFLGKVFYSDKKTALPLLVGKWTRPMEVVGRNTIFIYILHQPVIFGVLMLMAKLMGYSF